MHYRENHGPIHEAEFHIIVLQCYDMSHNGHGINMYGVYNMGN